MKRIVPATLLALFVLAGLTSCDSSRMYDEYQNIPEMTWHKDSVIAFDVPVTDTKKNHHILIQVRHNTDYPYSNLWLFIEVTQPDGQVLSDTLEIALAEPSGRWLGKGNGSLRTIHQAFRQQIYFPVSGSYRFTLQQGMRDEWLQGVHDVGIRIERISQRE